MNFISHVRRVSVSLFLMTLILPGIFCVSAQTTTGSIYGTVADPSGAVIGDVSVTIDSPQTGATLTTKTNSDGSYVFPVVDPGMYQVKAVMSGFSTMTQKNVQLSANQNVHVNFSMRTGEVNTEVSVSADTVLVDTRESQLGETIDQKRIQDLPLVGRSAYDLVQLVPGVTNYSASAPIGDLLGTEFSTNGQRVNFNSFYLDGAYNTSFFRGGGNILPNPDALSEFRILTSNFDAEFGRLPGAVVNSITRSGVNQFHGTAYDFIRNSAITAKNYFVSDVPQLVYNVFGAGVGGPILHDRAFFYLSYQGMRISQPTIVPSSAIVVPTDLERKGDFRQSAKKPTGTFCGTQYVLCPSSLDPVTMRILDQVPHGINGTSVAPEQRAASPTRSDQGTARIDWQATTTHKLQFTYFNSQGTGWNRTPAQNRILTYGGNKLYNGQWNYVLGDTWIVSPNAVNSVRVFYTKANPVQSNALPGNTLTDLGSAIPQGAPVPSQVQFNIVGYFGGGAGGSGANDVYQVTYGISDTLNLTKGKHTVKLGGAFQEFMYKQTAAWLGNTQSTFNGNITGNALSDFMQGRATNFAQNNGTFLRQTAPDPSLFAQDNWHISHRLTLNLGLRWEVYYPFAGQNNLGTFVPGVQSTRFPNAPLGLLSSGDPGVPDGLIGTSYLKFAPRVGFAYDVFGTGKTALRGGYGIFYASSAETLTGNLEQQPFALAVAFNNTTSFTNPYLGIPPYNGVSPFPYTVDLNNPRFYPGATLAGVVPGTKAIPYVQEYNLTLEQQYGTNWSTRIAYVGNVGRHYNYARDQNAAIYAPNGSVSTAGINARRPYQGYAAISQFVAGANSSYNSLQATLTRRMSRHFSLMADYVWSKTLDYVSNDPGGPSVYAAADQYDLRKDYGLSTLHVPHRFVASALYQLPGVRMWGVVGKQVLSGWQLNAIVSLSSGSPFNITSNRDTNLDGIATDRPNLVGNPYLSSGRSRKEKINEYFNKAAFAIPPAGQPFGNTPRNPLIGPGDVHTDASLFKRFPVYREGTLLFRAEFFNLFNNVNLGNPNGTFGTANFGKISSAGQPRTLQFALKYEF